MTIKEYVAENYDTLPKSTFNDEELVIVREDKNEDRGYGHHSYSGFGIDKAGNVMWCYSSGCSCDGSCGTEHVASVKRLKVSEEEIKQLAPATVNFKKLQVSFENYG